MSAAADPVAAARREIERLIYHYAELQDAADWDAIAEMFEHGDFLADSGVGWRGKEIAERRTANVLTYDDGTPRTRHVTTNLTIEVDPERGEASAESCYTILQGPPALPLQPIAAGRYIDRFERVDGRWRFSIPAQRPRPDEPLRRLPPRLRAAGGVGAAEGRRALVSRSWARGAAQIPNSRVCPVVLRGRIR